MGLALTVALAVLMLKVPQVVVAFAAINRAVDAVASATRAGTSFVFGYVGGGEAPFEVKTPAAQFILGFQALPGVLVMTDGMPEIRHPSSAIRLNAAGTRRRQRGFRLA